MKAKNQPVGTVECNRKGCTEICKVYRFRPRPGAEGRRTVFSGKHYFECPKDGRIGADGNPAVNEYILCNAKMDSAAATAASPEKNRAPATTPARVSSSGAQATEPGLSQTAPSSTTSGQPSGKSKWAPLIDLE